jgi:DNA invertase Pin-like site-specific DNA recombinase
VSELLRSPKLRPWHLDRQAVVYVRQSTLQQVLDHKESTARQYALADRAVALGWPRERVTTIDDDLGKSGQSIEGRPGFQRLLAEVALDHVGLILGLEMSRLARSCKDWHQLLELCGRYRVLLADADGIYDPTEHSDRRLLGLHGVMNAAELHGLKQRMYQGKLNKARRGELLGTPPIGYLRVPTGEWAIDPDEQVQAVVRLIFDQFDREATRHGLLQDLVDHQVRIPVRLASGPSKGPLEWRRPNRVTLQNLLRHPSYAGAYRFGHRPTDPRKKQPGRPSTGKPIRRPEDCLVLIRDRLPAYITWESFEANQARLTASRQLPATPGAPRNGPAVRAGLVRCGRCGRRMVVRYAGPRNSPSYTCTRGSADYAEPLCQSLSNGTALDELVTRELLAAVEPAALEASLAAVAGVERERAELARQWQLRRERAAYEGDRACRQYQACEPENRLVARELERRWEEALKAQRRLDDEYDRWQRAAPARLSDAALSSIRALAADLPSVGSAATTTAADRQRVARLLLEKVVVSVDRASERVDVELHGVGGAVRPHAIVRPVVRYSQQSEYPRLVARLRELCSGRRNSAAIAQALNAEGFRPPKRTGRFTGEMVRRLTAQLGLARRQRHGSVTGLGPDEYRPMGLARRLGVSRDTVRGWVRRGWVTTRTDADGHHIVWADADELRRLGQLPGLRPSWANKERLAALRRPKPRPKPGETGPAKPQ